MAFASYDKICKDLYRQIHAKLEKRDNAEMRFAKVGTAREILQQATLNRLYRSVVVPQGASIEDYFGPDITAEILVSRTTERRLHDFLATLIYARCSIEAARNFITSLLVASTWPKYLHGGRRLDQLPADDAQLRQVLGTDSDSDINGFLDTQPCFCPIVLLQGEDIQIPQGERRRLPYLSDVRLGEGAYGEVFEVEIAAGHFRDNRGSMANTEPRLLARKDFKKSDGFQREYDNMKMILYTPRESKNILETLGSLQLGENTFSLFMPLAKCDLGKWMEKNPPPTQDSEKAHFLQCASGLADGLEFLHSEIQDPNHNRMVCYHMDLKPANILVFLDERDPTKMIWKISDFGMSRVKISRRNSRVDDRDISHAFERRGETTVSGTVNRRAEGTFLAPESSVSLPRMNEKSDVWSLGCVVSVILTYMEEGKVGIEKYSDERSDYSVRNQAGGGDFFYIRHTNFTRRTNIHPAVKNCHRRLAKKAKQRSSKEGEAIEGTLQYLEERILQLDPDRRDSAKSISEQLLKASDVYLELSSNIEDDEEPRGQGIMSRMLQPLKRLVSHRQDLEDTRIRSWRLAEPSSFIGCSISQSGVVIACWTREHIKLYNAQSFLPYRGKEVDIVAKHRLDVLGEWKSVRLTERYLIASTTGPQPHFYLFDMDVYGISGPCFRNEYEITLPTSNQTGVHQIAISPGGKIIACVAPQDENTAWVYYVDIKSLLKSGTQVENTKTASTSDLWKHFSVDAPERNVTHLTFSSDDCLCAVTQPDIDRQHRVGIFCLSLHPGKEDGKVVALSLDSPLNKNPQDFDSGNSGRLFTTLAAVDDNQTFAIVRDEKTILLRSFRITDDFPLDKTTGLQNYFIAELLVDKQRSRIFALGQRTGKHAMLLLELPVSHSGYIKPIEIREIPGLHYSDKFVARFLNSGDVPSTQGSGDLGGAKDGGAIIITSYATAYTTIYWINLHNSR
ncbi:kinase-like protein [Annulohypoxylon nitens]|nr:kinase-like protein [Annulohypoxylon nitens]